MPGFVKIDGDIFGSSLMEEKPVTRLVWFFFLASADKTGKVDETHKALARRFNLPLGDVEKAIEDLEQPDEISRSPAEDGRRIIRLDEHRAWGWQIVNYALYRNARNAEERRAYKTAHQASQRAAERSTDAEERLAVLVDVGACPQLSTAVHTSPRVDNVDRCRPMQKQSADAEADAEKAKSAASPPSPSSMPLEWRNLGITKAEAAELAVLVEHPERIDPDAMRATHVTDEKAMRIERLHLLAELVVVSEGFAAADTSLQLWCSWRLKARAKAKPRLPAASTKDWRNEVETLRKLRERVERRVGITMGELNGWRGFEWAWVEKAPRRSSSYKMPVFTDADYDGTREFIRETERKENA